MNDINLSPHFRLSELTRSSTATRLGIDNTPSREQVKNLTRICEKILEPLRSHINSPAYKASSGCLPLQGGGGSPLIISSGYRCPMLNRAVGGSTSSQHMTGEAVDIRLPTKVWPSGQVHTDKDLAREWLAWIADNCRFDQLIFETTNCLDYWIHVSLKAKGNRQQVISHMLKT